MKATQFVKMSLENTRGFALQLLEDMKDQPLTQPTAQGGNHPLWVLGHLVHSESALLDQFILGRENRFPELAGRFAPGTTPTTNAEDYPSMDELFAKFDEVRAATLAHLDTLTDEDLDKRSHAPAEFGPVFETVGACFAAMAAHVFLHAGQVTDARRAAGKSPLVDFQPSEASV